LAFGSRRGETIWALKDVSFEVRRGEVVGLIGRNGAGKSTLLKILSRITEPTEGYADIHGRVASLLEVGTGFQPELTGRENIYLNGSILGMKHAEIRRKFDEIVSFAEVEKFIDTPVKHYSSGMYMRLAFAVAAHLEPEILLVDEVLAVGDAAFQKKCLGKLGDVAKQGRTVLFVSHNMGAIQRLCPNSLMLKAGQLVKHGPTESVVSDYLNSSSETLKPDQWVDVSQLARHGTGQVRFKGFKYTVPTKRDIAGPNSYDSLEITMELESDTARSVGSVAVTLYDQYGTKLVNADTLSFGRALDFKPGANTVAIRIERLFLNTGIYTLGLWTADPLSVTFDHVESAGRIKVLASVASGFGETPRSNGLVPCSFDVVSPQ
jgi:ABC-type polysaccharide/polyol phosphate transport system ATPase subunit